MGLFDDDNNLKNKVKSPNKLSTQPLFNNLNLPSNNNIINNNSKTSNNNNPFSNLNQSLLNPFSSLSLNDNSISLLNPPKPLFAPVQQQPLTSENIGQANYPDFSSYKLSNHLRTMNILHVKCGFCDIEITDKDYIKHDRDCIVLNGPSIPKRPLQPTEYHGTPLPHHLMAKIISTLFHCVVNKNENQLLKCLIAMISMVSKTWKEKILPMALSSVVFDISSGYYTQQFIEIIHSKGLQTLVDISYPIVQSDFEIIVNCIRSLDISFALLKEYMSNLAQNDDNIYPNLSNLSISYALPVPPSVSTLFNKFKFINLSNLKLLISNITAKRDEEVEVNIKKLLAPYTGSLKSVKLHLDINVSQIQFSLNCRELNSIHTHRLTKLKLVKFNINLIDLISLIETNTTIVDLSLVDLIFTKQNRNSITKDNDTKFDLSPLFKTLANDKVLKTLYFKYHEQPVSKEQLIYLLNNNTTLKSLKYNVKFDDNSKKFEPSDSLKIHNTFLERINIFCEKDKYKKQFKSFQSREDQIQVYDLWSTKSNLNLVKLNVGKESDDRLLEVVFKLHFNNLQTLILSQLKQSQFDQYINPMIAANSPRLLKVHLIEAAGQIQGVYEALTSNTHITNLILDINIPTTDLVKLIHFNHPSISDLSVLYINYDDFPEMSNALYANKTLRSFHISSVFGKSTEASVCPIFKIFRYNNYLESMTIPVNITSALLSFNLQISLLNNTTIKSLGFLSIPPCIPENSLIVINRI